MIVVLRKISARFQLENWSAPARLGSARNLHSSGSLEPENSSSNSSLLFNTSFMEATRPGSSALSAVWFYMVNFLLRLEVFRTCAISSTKLPLKLDTAALSTFRQESWSIAEQAWLRGGPTRRTISPFNLFIPINISTYWLCNADKWTVGFA